MNHTPIFLSRYDHQRLRTLVAAVEDDARLRELLSELNRAIVVPGHARVPGTVVTVDSRVIFENVETGATTEVVLAFPENADPARGAISVLEPLGTALLGCSQGDVVTLRHDGVGLTLRILHVVRSAVAEAAAMLTIA